jgi:S-adenosylmethionine synthetase
MRTAEAVSKGHPDKICDQISDAILDDILKQDPDARVAIETMGGHGIITITGELTTKAFCYMDRIAKKVYKDLGYDDEIGVQVNVISQSPDISQGVDTGGAGDQGIMVGYACNDNAAMIPQELYLARKLISLVLENKDLGPDAKSQITINDNEEVSRIVLSVQHKENVEVDEIEEILYNILKDNKEFIQSDDCEIIVNGTGKFTVAGFTADTELTGRKIVQDAYGPQVAVGGGAFSGKDPSKVDRSAAYMARYLAVQVLKKEPYASEAIVKIAYSIGVARPLMVSIEVKDSTGWTKAGEEYIDEFLAPYDLTPQGIIKFLDLKKPIYQKTAKDGHFGHGFKWDK